MKTFQVDFLGCKVNAYEMEALREGFRHLGLSEARHGHGADVYVLNTCSVTANAGGTSRKRVRRALRENPGADVLVTGCYAESDRARLEGINGVRRLFGNDEKEADAATRCDAWSTVRVASAGTKPAAVSTSRRRRAAPISSRVRSAAD